MRDTSSVGPGCSKRVSAGSPPAARCSRSCVMSRTPGRGAPSSALQETSSSGAAPGEELKRLTGAERNGQPREQHSARRIHGVDRAAERSPGGVLRAVARSGEPEEEGERHRRLKPDAHEKARERGAPTRVNREAQRDPVHCRRPCRQRQGSAGPERPRRPQALRGATRPVLREKRVQLLRGSPGRRPGPLAVGDLIISRISTKRIRASREYENRTSLTNAPELRSTSSTSGARQGPRPWKNSMGPPPGMRYSVDLNPDLFILTRLLPSFGGHPEADDPAFAHFVEEHAVFAIAPHALAVPIIIAAGRIMAGHGPRDPAGVEREEPVQHGRPRVRREGRQ